MDFTFQQCYVVLWRTPKYCNTLEWIRWWAWKDRDACHKCNIKHTYIHSKHNTICMSCPDLIHLTRCNNISFSDNNECTLDTHNCHDDATCTNTYGSFYCTCNTGFTGNGVNCSGMTKFHQYVMISFISNSLWGLRS